eukprot:Tbor_TRINITY_DN6049_c0_g2::TRINITY_DN6049_c0_g2_i1::g.10600::m.10600/K15285/SLC35E3; solute carrier family 35, member E3
MGNYRYDKSYSSGCVLDRLQTPTYIFVNLASAIVIAAAQKSVFEYCRLSFGTILTSVHLLLTFFALELLRQLGVFEFKHIPFMKRLSLSIVFCCFVFLVNKSLYYNDVSYHVGINILLITPLLMIIQTMFHKESFSAPIKGSIGIILFGAFCSSSINYIYNNNKGAIYAFLTVLMTCIYQILIATRQKEFKCNGYQLLYAQAPISTLMLIPLCFYFDFLPEIRESPPFTILAAVISSVPAIAANISMYLVIGKSGPVTYNVLGYCKLVIITCINFISVDLPLNFKNMSGVVIMMMGVLWYTHICTADEVSDVGRGDRERSTSPERLSRRQFSSSSVRE